MLDDNSQDISIPEAVVVLCTAPDEATAQDLVSGRRDVFNAIDGKADTQRPLHHLYLRN